MAPESVKRPKHYTSHPSGVECREITRWMNFNLGSVFKYIWRVDLKGNPIENLEKARDCLDDEIKRRTVLDAPDPKKRPASDILKAMKPCPQ